MYAPKQATYFVQIFGIVALLALFVALYSLFINRTLQYDEAYTFLYYAQDPFTALLDYGLPNNHLLHSFLVWVCTSLMGDGLVAIRFTAFSSGIISLALVFRLGRKIAGIWAGIFAMIILGTTYGFAEYIINARGYTLSIALTLIFMEYVLLPRYTRGRGYSTLLCCALLVMTLPSMALLIVATMGFVLFSFRRSQRFTMMSSMVLGMAIGVLFYVSVLFDYGNYRFGYSDGMKILQDFASLTLTHPSFHVLSVVGLILGIGACSVKKGYRPLFLLALWMIGIAIVFGLAQYQLTHLLFFPRNYLYFLPVIALMGGIGFASLKLSGAMYRAILFVGVLVGIPNIWVIGNSEVGDASLKIVEETVITNDLVIFGLIY